MLKPTVATGLVSLIVLSQSAIASALTVQDIPNPRRMNSWVADTADLLTPQTEAEIDRIATELKAKNGSEIAVVTVATTKPAKSSKAFATELFNTWKIGKQGKNNGVLLLISKSDRRTEIETGTGLTTLLPSSKVEMILTQTVTPQYKQGKFDEGTVAGTRAIATALGGNPPPTSALSPWTQAWNLLPLIAGGIAVGVGVFSVFSTIYKIIKEIRNPTPETSPREVDHSSSTWDSDRNSYSSSSDSSSHSDSSSSSSSDSGGSDFGGGSSDGGGSGDSW